MSDLVLNKNRLGLVPLALLLSSAGGVFVCGMGGYRNPFPGGEIGD